MAWVLLRACGAERIQLRRVSQLSRGLVPRLRKDAQRDHLNVTSTSCVPTRQFGSNGQRCTVRLLLCMQVSKRVREGFSARPYASSMLPSIHSSNTMYIQICFRKRTDAMWSVHITINTTADSTRQPEPTSRASLLSVLLALSLINIMKKPTRTPPAKSLFTTKDGPVPCVF